MSTIDKLRIEGIRSFDIKRGEAIYFHTPLTLIVGYNGSGKTTIIECLKYATTGELPPNSKTGGAFIHDPKLCGEKDVFAQVKLGFKGINGEKMVVTRNLQLTVKKTARTFKTLEGQLLVYKDGERTTTSSRVLELDQLVPQYLGVSKAILNSVIFCHQDDSLWPMSEPGPLKKKFDEIFEASKYTKAIDDIKKMRKDQGLNLTNYKLVEQHAKEVKAQGEKAEKAAKQLQAELDELEAEVKELDANMRDAREKGGEAEKRAAQYAGVVKSLEVHQTQQKFLQSNIKSLRGRMKERHESDEWLQSEVDQYEQHMAIHEQCKQQQSKQYENLKYEIDRGRERLRQKHIEAGKHEEQRANHENQIERRKVIIKDTSRIHSLRGYDTADLDDMEINEFMDKISRLSKDQNAAVEKARQETEREMQKAQDALSKLGERKSALTEGKVSSKREMATNDRNIGTFQADLNRIDIDEGGKAILQDDIDDLEARLKKAREEANASSWENKIQNNKRQLRLLEGETEQLNRDLVQGTKQADCLATLNHLKKEVADRHRKLDTLKGVHNERLQKVVGREWQPSTLETDFQAVVDESSRQLKDAERQRDVVSRSLEQVEFKLSNTKSELKKGEKELENCVQRLKGSISGEPEDYSRTLAEMQKDRDTLKADVDNFANQRKFYTDGIALAQKENKCKLCTRAFHGREKSDFVSRLETKIANQTLAELKIELKDVEAELQRGHEAGPSHDTWTRLSRSELPRLHGEVKYLSAERNVRIRESEEHDAIVRNRSQSKSDVDSLAKNVADIVKNSEDAITFSRQIQELVAKQKDAGLDRTLEDIQEQLELFGAKSRGLQKIIDNLTADKERAYSQISRFELDLSKAENKLSTASHQLQKRADILKHVGELRSTNQFQRNILKDLDDQIGDLIIKVAEEEVKIADIKRRGSDKEKGLQREASKLSDSVYKLNHAEQGIRAYVDDAGPAKLTRCQREVETAQQEIQRTEEDQKQVIVSINKVTEELRNHEETKRTIIDNIEHRDSLRKLEVVKNDIANLSAQNAEADQEKWQKEASTWAYKLDVFKAERAGKLGTSKAKDQELGKLVKDWKTEYKEAAGQYKNAHIRVETTKAAVEDLGRYAGALDKAIMKFHSIKMEEINRIIEELWKKTYQGTDVDSVLIRSDNEEAGKARSYNYRVCMVKEDAEMDMRGRCSAGQKVLASIIIRLALAECFGVNCGLIALDEPTTNLDRDNIRSLATSLHDIIETRRHQSNFQLIVITHDEEFLKSMRCPDFCDYYWRVSRDDRQKSIIERQSISEVM